jgi:adsorption protein B
MFVIFVFIILFLVCFFVIDDLIIDWIAFTFDLGPQELTQKRIQKLKSKPEKNIAIIIANWQEHEVIHRMVYGNLSRLDYTNYHFFLGVYPNDIETNISAQNVSSVYKNVHTIENTKNGPTSKGQMLNELVRGVFLTEKSLGIEFDVFLMHDSEDILHPLSLKVINSEIDKTDFLQIPIFSFDRPATQMVGSTYIDEFAEIHTKDLFVRQYLKAPVPSAGVGTSLQRKLMMALMRENQNDFLREDSLTEDYVLGMSSAIKGFRTSFCCYYVKDEQGNKDFIATREYFPNKYQAAIRQKTRWILGIVLQGSRIIPWDGAWIHKYFLYRDRRGPMNNFVAMATTALTIYLLIGYSMTHQPADFTSLWWFKLGSVIATIGMLNRLVQRVYAVGLVNGWKKAWLVPLRWPLGNLINFVATLKAFQQFHRAVVKKEPLKWSKTEHELPSDFGHEETKPQNLLV